MVPRAPPAVGPPSVLRPDYETLAQLPSTWSKPLDLDVCPTLCSSSVGFVAQLINCSPLSFEAQTKKPTQWFWCPNHQNIAVSFEVQTEKDSSLVLRPKQEKLSLWFWYQTIEKPSTLVLRLNQETRAPLLLVHSADHTECHPTSRSSGHWVPDMCLTIPGPLQQVFYSSHDPHRYPSCRTCHLHITRQANTIVHTKQR
jgi:hypothetical protein